MVPVGEGVGIVHPHSQLDTEDYDVLLDVSDHPAIPPQPHRHLYIYAGAGSPPEDAALWMPHVTRETDGRYRLPHPSILLLEPILPLETMRTFSAISLVSLQGASVRGRSAREALVSETVQLLEYGAEGSKHHAFNLIPRGKRGHLSLDLRELVSDQPMLSAREIESPTFHGIALAVSFTARNETAARSLFSGIRTRMNNRSRVNLFLSVKEERTMITDLGRDRTTVWFTLFADEILNGVIPALQTIL